MIPLSPMQAGVEVCASIFDMMRPDQYVKCIEGNLSNGIEIGGEKKRAKKHERIKALRGEREQLQGPARKDLV